MTCKRHRTCLIAADSWSILGGSASGCQTRSTRGRARWAARLAAFRVLQAHLRSHSGAGCAGTGVRTAIFSAPLVTEARCECGAGLDQRGRHRLAGSATERTLARVCCEAGASVRCNANLRDMNIAVPASDERIEVLSSGLPLVHGAQMAVDITLRSALTSRGEARPNVANVNGAVLASQCSPTGEGYQVLGASRRHKMPSHSGRVAGARRRWVRGDARRARARDASLALQRSAFLAERRRWSRMLSISCSSAFACSLVSSPAHAWDGTDGAVPDLADLFQEA